MGTVLLHVASAEHAASIVSLRTTSANLSSSFVILISAARTLAIVASAFSWHTHSN